MKSLPAGLQEHLDGGATTLCWCWRVDRADGASFGFTDHDRALYFGGLEYEPDSGFGEAEIRNNSSLSVDAQEAAGALTSERITETDILDGLWDNATIYVYRVNWSAVSQRVLVRRGNIGQVRRGKTVFVAEVRSLAHHLNQTVGRTYQFYCDAQLGDGRCGVNLDAGAFKGTGSVASITGDRSFAAAGLATFAAAWFEFGFVTWTSGSNAGRRAEVARHSKTGGAVEIVLMEAPVLPIAASDTFEIRAGCDKQFATCGAKFGNAVNFRGFPRIPGNDLVVRYASRGDRNSGEPL